MAIGAVSASLSIHVATYLIFPDMHAKGTHAHGQAVLGALLMFSFIMGTFVGRRAIRLSFLTDLIPTFVGSFSVLALCCFMAYFEFTETMVIMGLAAIGWVFCVLITAVVGSMIPEPPIDAETES